MGVPDLWSVLSDLCERKPLTYLSGKNVAVDLSGWVVQATQCKGLQSIKNPHLRNLFYRVSRLLQLDVHPIFVIEGKPPSIKEATIKERNGDRYFETGSQTVSRQSFDRTLLQCQDLLRCLGVPCVKSSGEAEAFCAFLCLHGIVDGVITEDNDAFLYGADVVYRDFTIEGTDSHVNVYCLKSDKNKLQLDRQKLVAFALLLGCDYSKGVPGIGKEAAIKLLSELNGKNILQRFNEWNNLSETELFPGLEGSLEKKNSHCTRCGHLGSHGKHKNDGCAACNSDFTCYLSNDNPCACAWHIAEETKRKQKHEIKVYNAAKKCSDFPNQEVINEYLNFSDSVPSKEVMHWDCPNVDAFRETALNYLGWTFENSFEKIFPLITLWQQSRIRHNKDKAKLIYEPVQILKERVLKKIAHFEVQWKLIDNNSDLDTPTENLTTLEEKKRFSGCYEDLVDSFYLLQSVLKEQKKKTKVKKADVAESNTKIDEYFRVGKSQTMKSIQQSCSTSENNPLTHTQFDGPNAKRICIEASKI